MSTVKYKNSDADVVICGKKIVNSEIQTQQLNVLLDRFKQGDRQALNELLRRTSQRMESLARSMLRRFPVVRDHEQTADIVQESTLSLINALAQVNFTSTREYYGLAAEHMRRRLLDLARRYSIPTRAPERLAAGDINQMRSYESNDDNLEKWEAFHDAIEHLPTDLREVISLRFYHDWSVGRIAEEFQISTRSVARLYCRAILELTTILREKGFPATNHEATM